jgi:hypothetical protein
MKLTRKIFVAVLASLASASLLAALSSFWYLWHVASRVKDPSRGLVYPVLLGTNEEGGTEFSVYLSSTESVIVFPELYFLVCGIATVLLVSILWWRFPIRK